jgi:hypothetical protein
MNGHEGDLTIWQFGLIVLVAGIVFVVGALRRWEWLVDPPEEYKWFYTQSLLKAVFGSEWCRGSTLSFGVMLIVIGTLILGSWLF